MEAGWRWREGRGKGKGREEKGRGVREGERGTRETKAARKRRNAPRILVAPAADGEVLAKATDEGRVGRVEDERPVVKDVYRAGGRARGQARGGEGSLSDP